MTPALFVVLFANAFGVVLNAPPRVHSFLANERAPNSMALRVSSSAFSEAQSIPEKYSCDGQNVSPPLRWEGTPENTRSIAVIVDDPDAPSGTFTHWVLYDLPPKTTQLEEGSSGGGKEGINGFRKAGYGGPCPPPNNTHRYFFRVYALDIHSLGGPGLSKQAASAAVKGHILAEGALMGKYRRTK